MLLYLIRHGESLFNAEKRIQGQSDVELSPLGHRQAQALAAALAGKPIDAIFSSPLKRAYQTAEAIAAKLNLPVQTDDRLKEINAGMFQGLLWDEIVHLHPAEAAHWKAMEPDFVIPGGESRRTVGQRGRAAFEKIRETGLHQVVVVSHGGVMAGALKSLLAVPAELNPFAFYNASISRLAWDKQVKVLSINQLEHLAQIEVLSQASAGDL
ncbi:MAG TPA: histidine phosphatase family protein [Pirellulales bacterium]|jgi:broad specificity phosphatase PhoE